MSKRIVKILMDRDDITEEEALDLVQETREEINATLENGGSYDEVEDIIADMLGLELDYAIDLLM